MEEKKKLKIGIGEFIVILLIVLMSAAILVGILYIKYSYDKQINDKNDRINALEKQVYNGEVNLKNIETATKVIENNISNEPIKTTQNTNIALEEVKKCLKDTEWLKKNIYLSKEEQIVNGDLSDQVINFSVCKSNDNPIVVLEVLSENCITKKIVLVTYLNGSVSTKNISQGHAYHGGYEIDTNKGVVRSSYMHMGNNSTALYSVANGSVKFLGMYTSEDIVENDNLSYRYSVNRNDAVYDNNVEVTKTEFDKFKASLNESQYNFTEISTKLTNANVDAYVK